MQLQRDLLNLDIDALELPESVKSYFRYDLNKLSYVSRCNAFLLYHVLKDNKAKDQGYIVDHGAGIGLFSFLVKRMGYSCISHDIFEEYLDGIRKMGRALKALPDLFVLGDTDALISYCHFHDYKVIGLASRNVIEHLPDYKQFFKDVFHLGDSIQLVISTSANIHNPIVKQIHHRIHRQYENEGTRLDMDQFEMDQTKSGMSLRSEIIKSSFPDLAPDLIKELAILNRTFVKPDIIQRTEYYVKTGRWPSIPLEESNSCDPLTGAWVERLVSFSDYQAAARESGFSIEALPGFYNTHYSSPLKNLAAAFLNVFLKFKHPFLLNISPFLAMKLVKAK